MNTNYIICMKWGKKYGADYVNRLYRMVCRHLSLPFTMVCLTDDPQGIDPAVVCYPIPPLPLPDNIPERGWKKLVSFGELYGLQGTALFLDIDIVIIDSIDELFTHQSQYSDSVMIIKDWKKPWRMVGNSSVYRFNIGAYDKLLPYFVQNFQQIRQTFRHEQAFLSHFLRQNYHLEYWPATWCVSFKYHCLYPVPLAYFIPPKKPNNAKIVVFHGEINPPDAIAGGGGKWYRHALPCPWVLEAWQ